jgi:hypothetical protein
MRESWAVTALRVALTGCSSRRICRETWSIVSTPGEVCERSACCVVWSGEVEHISWALVVRGEGGRLVALRDLGGVKVARSIRSILSSAACRPRVRVATSSFSSLRVLKMVSNAVSVDILISWEWLLWADGFGVEKSR